MVEVGVGSSGRGKLLWEILDGTATANLPGELYLPKGGSAGGSDGGVHGRQREQSTEPLFRFSSLLLQ